MVLWRASMFRDRGKKTGTRDNEAFLTTAMEWTLPWVFLLAASIWIIGISAIGAALI